MKQTYKVLWILIMARAFFVGQISRPAADLQIGPSDWRACKPAADLETRFIKTKLVA